MNHPTMICIVDMKTDLIGSEGVLSTDLIGMNDEWPTADAEGRQKILDETATFTKGLLWFFANDESVPVSFHLLLLSTNPLIHKLGRYSPGVV